MKLRVRLQVIPLISPEHYLILNLNPDTAVKIAGVVALM